jgi:hypothetical protein
MIDPKAAYQKLRAETAEMLGLSSEPSTSLITSLQVDLISLLKLEVDTLQGRVFAGEDVDLDRLSTSLGMLTKLLPEQSLQAAPIAEQLTSAEEAAAQAELEKTIDCYVAQRHLEMAANPELARQEFERELQAALERFPPAAKPAVLLTAEPAPTAAPAATAPKTTKATPAPAPSERQPSATELFYRNGGYSSQH